MTGTALVDWAPLWRLLAAGALLAFVPLCFWMLRHRTRPPVERLRALTAITLFLTFDLVLFGAFTRLTDSGLGCPDWPGCYGHASPLGAQGQIAAEQALRPDGPVTHGKAWVEMVHRYLATGVGALVTVMMTAAWIWHWRGSTSQQAGTVSPWWPTALFAWICLQGAFGAWTVTLKLYPAIVTAHLLGGIGLLVLLAVQHERLGGRALTLPPGLQLAAFAAAVIVVGQIALGGWVSTNYAVLACSDFPTCGGHWWPPADYAAGFSIRRELGYTAAGDLLPFDALVAIHWVHRLGAVVVTLVLAGLAAWLWRIDATARKMAIWILGLLTLQLLTGLSNVVLGWPMTAAVLHTAGAAGLAMVLARLLSRSTMPAHGRSVDDRYRTDVPKVQSLRSMSS